MFPNELDFMVGKQRNQDLLREIERERIIRLVRQAGQVGRPAHRQVIAWLGTQLVKWGARLQAYDAPRSASLPAGRVIHLR